MLVHDPVSSTFQQPPQLPRPALSDLIVSLPLPPMSHQIPKSNPHLESIRPLHEYTSTVLSHAYSCYRHDLNNAEAELLVTKQTIDDSAAHLKDINSRIILLSEHQGESQTDGGDFSAHDVLVNTRREQMELLNKLQATALRLNHSVQTATSHMAEISTLLQKRRNEATVVEGQLLSRLDLNEGEGRNECP